MVLPIGASPQAALEARVAAEAAQRRRRLSSPAFLASVAAARDRCLLRMGLAQARSVAAEPKAEAKAKAEPKATGLWV